MKQIALIAVFAITLAYLIFAFSIGQINPFDWKSSERVGMVLFSFFLAGVTIIIKLSTEDKI
jgi:hypothetical protein